MPEMIINGLAVNFRSGETVLQAALAGGIHIPALCHHPGLGHFGSCRLCLVEILAGGRPGLAASCSLPASEDLVVETGTERVVRARRVVLGLLLARCPDAKPLLELAENLGAVKFTPRPGDPGCILCGRCVRACRAVGANVIGFAWRGRDRRVAVPFDQPPADCLGCRACEQVCPVNVIKVVEDRGRIRIFPWQSEIEMAYCRNCGAAIGPGVQAGRLQKRFPVEGPLSGLCPACRRRFQAALAGGLVIQPT
ncbi:MAG: (2Fe-2S)-binding protein [Peptococcaceae bacterium]|nr:(2Fe-2S)-binding protein [Peptococcaceae bacterium]